MRLLLTYGTGVYGAGLARFLADEAVAMVEVDRPDRKARRWQGKSDPVDAEAAARAALAAIRTGVPKQRDGRIEALRNLRVARRSAISQRADVLRQMHALVVTAPEPIRATLRDLSARQLVTTCAAARPDRTQAADPAVAARVALRLLARRHQQLTAEVDHLDATITPLVAATAPKLLELNGVGTDVAGQLLVTAGQNPQRLRSEAAFAMLCGAAPLPASSGCLVRQDEPAPAQPRRRPASQRRALPDRALPPALDPRTRAYAERRAKDGLSKPEIIRCLKRYIAREIYTALCPPTT